MPSCPCHSQSDYSVCCEPIHKDHHNALKPEQLMRARYSAHVLGLVDFVINTYHPSCQAENQRQGIEESINSEWKKLEVTSTEEGSHVDEGYVTFSAYFIEEGSEYCMTERSRFIREKELWYYIDGEFPQQETKPDPRLSQPIKALKVGRNDPCICGSGKKFKKCCG
ncbi:YchJ family protein [Vibrio sp. TRT 17S01]|uniref:YchJ family protein n=1 Tax=Vibrio sp. TRT 17S01 TaxID=3418505 RepID=UPI003CF85669